MQISKIELTNFKNFEHLEVEFASGVNLFVGVNGSGKTGLLEGICVALGGFFGKKAQDASNKRYINYEEITISKGIRTESATVKAEGKQQDGVQINWQRVKLRDGKNTSRDVGKIADYGALIQDSFEKESRDLAPVIAYYSTQRLFSDAKQSTKSSYDKELGRHNGYLRCLDTFSIKPVILGWLGNAVTRRATLAIKEIDRVDLILENVETGIRMLLLDFLDLPSDFPLKIYQDPDYNNEIYLDYNGNPKPISHYSDGFRNIIFLVIDLIWRASQLNPWLAFDELSQKTQGVVLIDEVDLHLHPKWQGKIIPFLYKLFPEIQYFITTHSPIVVSHFKSEYGQLYAILDSGVKNLRTHFGHEANEVLFHVLDVSERPSEIQKELDRLFYEIDEESDVREPFARLKAILGENDPAIQRAHALMAWNTYKKDNPDAVH